MAGSLAGRVGVSEVTPSPALIGSADVWLIEGTRLTSPICLSPRAAAREACGLAPHRKTTSLQRRSHLRLPGALQLVHDYCIDLARLNVGQQALQGRAVHVAAGEAAVVVPGGQA